MQWYNRLYQIYGMKRGVEVIIVEITQLGKGKYLVKNDEEAFVSIYYKDLKGLGFVVDQACTEEQWAIATKSVIIRGKKRVFYLLSRKDYTEHEIRSKLVKEKYDDDQVKTILEYFENLGYIDDVSYSNKYYNYYKDSKSKRIIEQKLKLKGISSELLKELFSEKNLEKDAYKAAKKLAIIKYGGRELEKDNYQKMVQFLMRKGFDYSVCKNTIDALFKGELATYDGYEDY